jgi:hypothetical protein
LNNGVAAAVAVANNTGTGSWAFQILPMMEQQDIFATPATLTTTTGYLKTLACPGRGRPTTGSYTDYAWNCFLNYSATGGTTPPYTTTGTPNQFNSITIQGIADGSSNTILAGHKYVLITSYANTSGAGDGPIATGGTNTTGRGSNRYIKDSTTTDPQGNGTTSPGSWGGPFSAGGLFLMGDGSVRVIPFTFDSTLGTGSPQVSLMTLALNPADSQTIAWPN